MFSTSDEDDVTVLRTQQRLTFILLVTVAFHLIESFCAVIHMEVAFFNYSMSQHSFVIQSYKTSIF